MTTCKTCIFHDEIDDFSFYCDHYGVCSTEDMTSCKHYVPFDGAEEEEESEDEDIVFERDSAGKITLNLNNQNF